jgi:uncharacterized protein (DUF58 family)
VSDASRPTPRLGLYTSLVWALLVTAIVAGRPEVAALAMPFAIALAVGLSGSRPPELDVSFSLDAAQVNEGDQVELTVVIEPRDGAGVAWLDVELTPDAALAVDGPAAQSTSIAPESRAECTFTFTCLRWGAYRPCAARVVAYGAGRFFVRERNMVSRSVVRVHPTAQRLRSLVRPARLQGMAGAHVSRERGAGVEFADTRPFVPGDRVRSISWRTSARRGELWVGDRHPDRNADLVLFLDTFAAAGWGLDRTLDLAVEAAIGLARGHIGVNDRVGVVGLGGVLRWLPPGTGAPQLHRVVDAVLDSEVIASQADKGIDVIPVRGLPPRATVVALTPLLDRRAIALMGELRARGFDLVILECSPAEYLPPPATRTATLARRLWLLEREGVREQLRGAGAALVEWRRGTPLPEVLEAVGAWRRLPRRARV